MKLFISFLCCFMLLTSLTSFAIDIEPRTIIVNLQNHKEKYIDVKIDRSGPLCSDAHDVYVSYPDTLDGARFSDVNVSIREKEKTLLDVPIKPMSFGKLRELESFHGASFCISEAMLTQAHLFISYKKGSYTTLILHIKDMNQW